MEVKDIFGNPIREGDALYRIVNGFVRPCICTKIRKTAYFTSKRVKFTPPSSNSNNRWGRIYYIGQMTSRQQLINCTALGIHIDIPEEQIEFYKQLKNKI